MSGSNSSTSVAWFGKSFKAWLGRRGVYDYQTMQFNFSFSTSGTGRVTSLQIVLFALSEEFIYSKYIEGTGAGGGSVTVVDFSGDVKHIAGAHGKVTAPTDGDVEIYADTPEGEIMVGKIPANTTEESEIHGRYTYLKLVNKGTSDASYRIRLHVSDSVLLR